MAYFRRLVGLLCCLLAAAAQAQAFGPMALHQVAPDTWYAQGESALGSPQNQNFVSNAGVVITPAGVVVIDALGSPAAARRLLEAIGRLTPLPVTHVIVTHYHADHIYGLQEFQAAGARIVAHQGARDYLQSDTARLRLEASRQELAPWIDGRTRVVPADQWLAGDTALTPKPAPTCSSPAITCSSCAARWAGPRATWSLSRTPTAPPTGRASRNCRCSSWPTG